MSDLVIDAMHVAYGPVEVLHGVTMRVRAGEIAAIVGHNGAGKSTILKAVAGLAPLQRGSVQLGDKDVTRRKPHQVLSAGIAYMAQGQDLFPQMSVAENVWMGGYLLARKHRTARFEECMGIFPALTEKRSARAASLSGGQRQQLKLARALMTEPAMLLLDEPSAGLSPALTADALTRLLRLRDDFGIGMVLVEQNVQQALDIADRVFVIELGRVATTGSPTELLADGIVREVFLGQRDDQTSDQGGPTTKAGP